MQQYFSIMSETGVIYAGLFIGFALLVVMIRLFPGARSGNNQGLSYCRLDIGNRNCSVVKAARLATETKKLSDENYELVLFSSIEDFLDRDKQLPHGPLFMIFDNGSRYLFETILPGLIKENISIVIFFPLAPAGSKSEIQLQQLNEMLLEGG